MGFYGTFGLIRKKKKKKANKKGDININSRVTLLLPFN